MREIMDTNHQLFIRIKSFLNSPELINSPSAQELYNSFCALNDAIVQRIVKCEVLLQKKQKIEAVLLAQQTPNLFEQIDSVLIPERKILLILADLYGWKTPSEINMKTVGMLKKAVSEMEDLRPLLTEFRRIARTDQTENKLHLLREISRIDKGNNEWLLPLLEIENQYLPILIADAQKAIQNQNFERLEQINDEFKNSKWMVAIPSVVLQKVEKIVKQHHEDMVRKEAASILESINNAYAAFDPSQLEGAILCWDDLCSKENYIPDENQQIQVNDAREYLTTELAKQKTEQEFQLQLEETIALMNAEAPLQDVERAFFKAQETGLEIPPHIVTRVAQYRSDTEREQKIAALIKAVKIAGVAAAVLLLLTGAAVWTMQFVIENKQAKNLQGLILKKDIPAAQALLKEIETKYPKLANRPKLSQSRAALRKLEADEQERAEELSRLIKELTAQKEQWPLDKKEINQKTARAEKLAKSDIERSRIRELKLAIQEKIQTKTDEMANLLQDQLVILKNERDALLEEIDNTQFEAAQKRLEKINKLRGDIIANAVGNEEILADYKELFSSTEKLDELFNARKFQYQEAENAREKTTKAGTLNELETALLALTKKGLQPSDSQKDTEQLLKEIAYFKAILNIQGRGREIPQNFIDLPYFKDFVAEHRHEQDTKEVLPKIQEGIDELQQIINREKILFIRFQSGSSVFDLYIKDQKISRISTGSEYEMNMRQVDGQDIVMHQKNRKLTITIGDEEYNNCRLIIPKRFNTETLHSSRAPHQLLLEKLFSNVHSANFDAFANLQLILQDERCAPYWKMRFAQVILEVVAPLDRSPNHQLAKLQNELVALAKLDHLRGNPLLNKHMADRIALFFKNYNISQLAQNLEENAKISAFISRKKEAKLLYLGAALKNNGEVQFAFNKNLKSASYEVLCFDNELNFQVVGRYESGELLLNDETRDLVPGHLLFALPQQNSYEEMLNALKKDFGANFRNVELPKFWPLNMKGEGNNDVLY